MMRVRIFLAAVSLVALAPACTAIIGLEDLPARPSDGGTATPPPSNGPPPTTGDAQLDAALGELASAICGKSSECVGPRFSFQYQNVAECVSQLRQTFVWIAQLPATKLTAAQLRTCALQLKGLGCAASSTAEVEFLCELKGAKVVGESCLTNAQCATSFCNATPGTCGQCVAPPDLGDPCTLSDGCAAGTCNASKICASEAASFAPCDGGDTPCEYGHACNPNTLTCDPYPANFEACSESFPCSTSGVCVDSVCRPFTVGSPGDACGVQGQGVALCRLSFCQNGTCPPTLTEGGLCSPNGPYCPAPLQCVDGVCAGLPPATSCP